MSWEGFTASKTQGQTPSIPSAFGRYCNGRAPGLVSKLCFDCFQATQKAMNNSSLGGRSRNRDILAGFCAGPGVIDSA